MFYGYVLQASEANFCVQGWKKQPHLLQANNLGNDILQQDK